jgi:trehalose 6-phosphate synthase
VSARRRLIVVSNRAPVAYSRAESGERVARRGAGGLVTALAGLVRHHDVTWIASATSAEDGAGAEAAGGEAFEAAARDGSPYRLRLVTHDARAYDLFYNLVANPTLWFLQHYLWHLTYAPDVDPRLHAAWEDGYRAVNAGFADAVVAELDRQPDAPVFFHDYHLYLVPRLVRERRPNATLAHFVHIPWPQPDYWHVLPRAMREEVHAGLLANDVVGFHTSRWRRNFLRSCEETVGAVCDAGGSRVEHAGRETTVTARPISVDPHEFDELSRSDDVAAEERALVERRPDQLVLRVDRTDPSKNVVRGFLAFALLLDEHPELQGRVTMLALLDPSRQRIPAYVEYLDAVERVASDVNKRFGRDDWTPIDLRVRNNFAESVAAYKQFDVLLVNPIFDGLNLVAKEAPLVNARDGVVVLSENAGAHEELSAWTVPVNPFDIAGQAAALYAALTMDAPERKRRLEAIRAQVREHDLGAWIAGQLVDVDAVASTRG